MAEVTQSFEGWQHHERPPSLFRRFEFADYATMRAFLDRLAELSKETGRYPDIGFGKTYANITVHADDATAITDDEIVFAQRVTALAMGRG